MLSPYFDSAVLIGLYMTLLFGVAQVRRDNSLADVGWGMGFVLLAWWLNWAYPCQGCKLPALLVALWGLRLTAHLAWRKYRQPQEDWRYARWRRQWGRWAVVRAYLQVFLLQGVFLWVIALPLMQRADVPGWTAFQWAGIVVWTVGWGWETVADWQLMRLKSAPANKGKLMRSGLWRLSRHPNYFGELLVWWGIFLVVFPLDRWWISLLSPLTITWLLVRVSGVPLLEEKYRDNPEFQEYARRTNALLPDLRKIVNR